MPPGQEGKIELAVEHTDGYSGEVAKSASVATNDPRMPNFTLMLRARFKLEAAPGVNTPAPAAKRVGPLLVEPTDQWITSALTGSSTARSFFLVNQQPDPIHIRQVIPGGASFVPQLTTIEDGRRYELRVSTDPQLKPGHYTQTVRVVTDSKTNPDVLLDMDLTVVAKVFATPTSIIMPALPSSSDLSGINWPVITVRKLRDGGLKIKGYKSTLPFLKLELITDNEGTVYRVHLTLDRSKVSVGDYKGSILIETNDSDVPVIEIPIRGTFS